MLRYSFSKLFVLACAGLLLIVTGCDQSAMKRESASDEEKRADVTPTEQEQKVNAALDAVAKDLAAALENRSVRTLIKKEASEMLAGEPNVLYETIASKKIGGQSKASAQTFEEILAGQRASLAKNKGLSKSQAVAQVRKDAAAIPKFDIGVPVHLEDWNPKKTTPLVAFHHRQEIDDTELERVKAYDAQGNVHWLDAFEKPERPVVDVGINERTTADGKVRSAYRKDMRIQPPGGGGGSGGGGGGDDGEGVTEREFGNQEYLHRVYLHKDHDVDGAPDAPLIGGWTENAPEVRVRVRSVQVEGSDEPFSEVNEAMEDGLGIDGDDEWHSVNQRLFTWDEEVGEATLWFFFDHDEGDTDAEKTIDPDQYPEKTYTFDREYHEDSDDLGWDIVKFEGDPKAQTYYIDDGRFEVRSYR